jgi:RNA polymerase sigma factor (sigma-70 family)
MHDNPELLRRYAQSTSSEYKRVLRDRIVKQNLGLAKKIANNYSKKTSEPYDDLYQVACIGLCRAVETYNPDKNAKFSTWATSKMRGDIMHYLRDKSHTIKRPRAWVDSRTKALQMHEAGATHQEIAAATRIKVEDVGRAIEALQYHAPSSLDVSTDEDGPTIQVSGPNENRLGSLSIHDVLLAHGIHEDSRNYINATEICKAEGKYFQCFTRLRVIRQRLKSDDQLKQLIIPNHGYKGHTLIHMDLIVDFLLWVNREKYAPLLHGVIIENLESIYRGGNS